MKTNKDHQQETRALCNRQNRLITADPQGGYLSSSSRNSDASVYDRLIAAHLQRRSNTFVRCAGIMALFLAICASRAADLPRPGQAIDAGDSYGLKDGTRVLLHRLVNEAAVKHTRSKSVEPIVRQAGISGAPLVTIENGKANIVDLYYSEDSQSVADLMNVQEEGVAVFPVLINPTSRRRMIATDEIIVQFSTGIGGPQAVALFAEEGLDVVEGPVPSAPNQYLVRIASGPERNALTRAGQVAGRQVVDWAQPDFLCELEFYSIPNDTLFDKQQYLRNDGQNGAVFGADIRAENAWDITTGKPEVVIAIIDTGVDIDHQELNWQSGKIFLNPNEMGSGRDTNGIDDDGNGYIDDWRGWDFYSHDNNPRPGTTEEAAHGTSCAGIAAAQGNDGQGIAGVAYNCRVLPIKIISDDGSTFTSDFNLGRAIRYAADYADVLSSSWGYDETVAITSAIDYAATSGRNGKGAPPLFASGNATSTWWVQRFPVNVSSGSYRFSFYYKNNSTSTSVDKLVALDNISLIGADEYTPEPFFPRVDFETGTIPPGWSGLKRNLSHLPVRIGTKLLVGSWSQKWPPSCRCCYQ